MPREPQTQADARLTRLEAEYRRLHDSRDHRDRTARFVIEGVRSFLQAHAAGFGFQALIYSRLLLKIPLAQATVRRLKRDGVLAFAVSPERFRMLSRAARASGIAAIVKQRWTHLGRARDDRQACFVALRSVRAPGNIGTIARTAEAAGIAGLVLLGDDVDPFHPAVVRASMGGLFHLPVIRTTLPALTAWAGLRAIRLIGASPDAEHDFSTAPLAPPAVLLFGEERIGLTLAERHACDALVSIPIHGHADSLNIASAAAILIYAMVGTTHTR